MDSIVGIDGLPYSLSKPKKILVAGGSHSSLWKHRVVVPLFERWNPSVPATSIVQSRLLFKLLEHLVHTRTGLHVCPQLEESQGGFRWCADALVGSFVPVLSPRAPSHTFRFKKLTSRKRCWTSWEEERCVCSTMVSGARCGSACRTYCAARRPKSPCLVSVGSLA